MSTVHDLEEVSTSLAAQEEDSILLSILSVMRSNRFNELVMKSHVKSTLDCRHNSNRLKLEAVVFRMDLKR